MTSSFTMQWIVIKTEKNTAVFNKLPHSVLEFIHIHTHAFTHTNIQNRIENIHH